MTYISHFQGDMEQDVCIQNHKRCRQIYLTSTQTSRRKFKKVNQFTLYSFTYTDTFYILDINLGSQFQYLDAIIIIMFQIWNIENWERAHVEEWIEHPEVQSIAKDL